MRYLPHTPADIAQMLDVVGKSDLPALFDSIPHDLQLKRRLDLPEPLPEHRLLAHLEALAAKNDGATSYTSFLGGGMYRHYTPTAVGQLLLRQEFLTCYTPYQSEVSQGTLQAMFEFQTMVSHLLGLEVANASMYDGASGLAEAALMARRITRGRTRLVVAGTLHPHWRRVLDTYLVAFNDDIVTVAPDTNGVVTAAALAAVVDSNTYAVVLQSPNFLGVFEDVTGIAKLAHDNGALLVTGTAEPLTFALCKSPGELGADIAVAEGQSFGVPLQFGGPGLGLFATRDEYKRQIPGRLIGRTKDAEGRTAYCLTLATREQHIRREKATSNICTNVGLNALAATIYLTLMGKTGLRELARRNAARADYLEQKVRASKHLKVAFDGLYFNELAIRVKGTAAEALARLQRDEKILAGIDGARLSPAFADVIIACTTELNSKDEIDRLVAALDA